MSMISFKSDQQNITKKSYDYENNKDRQTPKF